MSGPLKGLRVIEMAALGPCPLAGQLLADLGADVIVVDRRSGQDISREVNRRGKRSVAIDIKSDGGRALVLRLVNTADILIEGFRPGVMERLGLGPVECAAQNPGLVFGRMTGWGQEGPLSKTAGHDINYLGLTGALHAIGERDRPPVPPLNLVADYGGGTMFLIMGLLAALFERQSSGEGQVVDAAMVDGVPAMFGLFQTLSATGRWTTNRGANWLDGGAPYYRCYETADGKFVSVGALEPQFFAELIERLGLETDLCQLRDDPQNWPDIKDRFEAVFLSKTRAEWESIFEGSDACVFPVLDFDEAADHPHNKARGIFSKENGLAQSAPAPRFTRSSVQKNEIGETTGADREAVLSEVGLDSDEIEALVGSGVIT